jgi:hypothetical protein
MNLVSRPRRGAIGQNGNWPIACPSAIESTISNPGSKILPNRQRAAAKAPQNITAASLQGSCDGDGCLFRGLGWQLGETRPFHFIGVGGILVVGDWFATVAESTSRTLIPYGLSDLALMAGVGEEFAPNLRRGGELRDAGAHAMCLGSINWTACLGAGVTPKSSDGD